jgi:DNA-binding CsgD family transcriptional regulator
VIPGVEKWKEIYARLSTADREHALNPEELEQLALAAFLTGSDAESYQYLERAHQGYLDHGETGQAVRCAFWLGMILMNAGEKGRSSGWFARGERLIGHDDHTDLAEKGLLLIPEGLGLLYAGNAARAQEIFERVEATGEKFDNADLLILGRLGQGQARIQQGNVTGGIRLLDETMIAMETERVFPLVKGIVYCAVIESCRRVWDLGRAQEWTSVLTRWCEEQPDIVPFRGECLVRRAEIFQLHGEWQKALEETNDACNILSQHPGESVTGEAYYRKAELQRLSGEFKAAEGSYLEAARWGRKPQPGFALLRLAQGQEDAAETSIRNSLLENRDTTKRAEILPAVVRIMIVVNHTEEAIEAAEELKSIASQFDTPYIQAMYSHCQGEVFLAEGMVKPALEQLQIALKLWNSLHLPYELACTRELKGILYRKLEDRDNSESELSAAAWIFEQLNATHDLERVNRLLGKKRILDNYGLTLREIQVLGLIASGETNKSVAGKLFISNRTVDRHVSNIFNKLGVSSRLQAITFALKNNILDG